MLEELQAHLASSIADAERHCEASQQDGEELREQFWAGVSLGQRQVLEFLQTGRWTPSAD